jgi:hypothetical protein
VVFEAVLGLKSAKSEVVLELKSVEGYVFSNYRVVKSEGDIHYVPVYFSIFFDNTLYRKAPVLI